MRRTAIVTGASRGLGRALAHRLAADDWSLVIDARDGDALAVVAAGLQENTPAVEIRAIPGDVSDPGHRGALVAAARQLGGLDALVNNASTLGSTPLPAVADAPLGALRHAFEVNVLAPIGLVQAALPLLRPGGAVVSITSDAAVEAYPGWGGYGASKAALERLSAVLAVERPDLRVYAVDPGDMATAMHAEAVPNADPAELADPADVAPAIVRLLEGSLPSGRYRAAELTLESAGAR